MSRIAYVNGAYVRQSVATVHIEDRGFQFADGVYEVWSVHDGRLLDSDGHFARLDRSLGELQMQAPMARPALEAVLAETLRRNRVRFGILYLQITRGTAPRDHAFPPPEIRPSIVVTARPIDRRALEARVHAGVAVLTMPDIRWGRCDIKSVSLLPNVLAKQAAREAHAFEAWLVDEGGLITEGASTTAWIVDANGRLRTRKLGFDILPGVTRATLLRVAQERQMPVFEEAFSVEEAKRALEAFMSSASGVVVPVVSIDGVQIGDGAPGPTTLALRAAYFEGVVH
ncbi:MAG: D-amino-acid transaminase [Hyphomonadaceae bacterium]|nr:MAG: D-alanine transaminase [Caulobacteraceae bacterium]MBT9445114.1 D-amino-acid transaminase [Hyphomonadaceae bacterium]TPW08438.1 MAG: D-alanine transaminase [Alphaproteobacteria bacterium]